LPLCGLLRSMRLRQAGSSRGLDRGGPDRGDGSRIDEVHLDRRRRLLGRLAGERPCRPPVDRSELRPGAFGSRLHRDGSCGIQVGGDRPGVDSEPDHGRALFGPQGDDSLGTPSQMRGAVAAIQELMINLIGGGFGPLLTGFLSDFIGGRGLGRPCAGRSGQPECHSGSVLLAGLEMDRADRRRTSAGA
jgi:hypothetical protein